MQKYIHKIYYVLGVILCALFLFLLVFFRLRLEGPEENGGYEVLTDYSVTTIEDDTAPVGIKQIYSFYLDGVEKAYSYLMVYSSHQNVKIFLEQDCIYQMSAGEVSASGRSPGHVWNQIRFSEEDNGKCVRVEITPVYKESVDVTPVFYFGAKLDIMGASVLKGLPIILLSVILIIIGIVYIIFILYNYQKSDVERHLLMLGNFAIQVGLWKIADTEMITLLFPRYPVISQLPYIALMLMCVSFMLYIKELYNTREHFVWYIPVFAGLVNMSLSLLLQYFGVADMRQMLVVTHVIIVIMAAVCVIMTIYEVRTIGWNLKIRRNVLCLYVCFIGAGLDMVMYYVSNGQSTNVLGMLGFMTYILVMGFGSMQEIKSLMDIGIKAQRYEKMAYHDQLTGLFNRTAFAEHIEDEDFRLEKSIIVVMDLNNLKECNDTLGHDKGDIYIKECARMINESFGDIGRCYRMGGDEFYVLLTNGDLHLCKKRVQVLKDRVAECDKVGDGFRMGIACGYKMYDRRLDYDIHETARRADKVMYQDKFAMKEL